MDHLKGKVFVDYLSDLKRNRIKAKLSEAGARTPARRRAGARVALSRPVRIVFAGTPPFAAAALDALADAGHDIVLVLTQPDRPAGRGMKLTPSAVKQAALARGSAACTSPPA